MADNYDEIISGINDLKQAVAELKQILQGHTTAVDKDITSLKGFSAQLQASSAQLAAGVGRTTQSLLEGSTSLSSMNAAISGSIDAIDGFAKEIPLIGGVLSKGIGGLNILLPVLTKELESSGKAFQDLSQVGGVSAKGIEELREGAANSLLTLDQFKSVVSSNAAGLAQYGGTVAEGRKSFEAVQTQLANFDTGLRNLGYTTETLAEGTANYMTLQSKRMMSEKLSNEQLRQGTSDYLRELDELSRVTGANKKELMSHQQQIQSEARWRAHSVKMAQEGEDKKRVLTEQQSLETVISSKNKEMGQGIRDIISSEGALVTDEARKLYQTIPQIQEWLKELAEGKTTGEEVTLRIAKASEKFALDEQKQRLAGVVGDKTPYLQYSGVADVATLTKGIQEAKKESVEAEAKPSTLTKEYTEGERAREQAAAEIRKATSEILPTFAATMTDASDASRVFAETLHSATKKLNDLANLDGSGVHGAYQSTKGAIGKAKDTAVEYYHKAEDWISGTPKTVTQDATLQENNADSLVTPTETMKSRIAPAKEADTQPKKSYATDSDRLTSVEPDTKSSESLNRTQTTAAALTKIPVLTNRLIQLNEEQNTYLKSLSGCCKAGTTIMTDMYAWMLQYQKEFRTAMSLDEKGEKKGLFRQAADMATATANDVAEGAKSVWNAVTGGSSGGGTAPGPQTVQSATPTGQISKSAADKGLKQKQLETRQHLITAMDRAGITDKTERAALLGQAEHETDHFRTLKEYGEGKASNIKGGNQYYGRGYLQITHKENYDKIGKMIGKDLVSHPELLNDPDTAADASIAYWKSRVKPITKDFGDVAQSTKGINPGELKAKYADRYANRKATVDKYLRNADDFAYGATTTASAIPSNPETAGKQTANNAMNAAGIKSAAGPQTSTAGVGQSALEAARAHLGQGESKAGRSKDDLNPWLNQYAGNKSDIDIVPWCARFVSASLEQAGIKSTKNASAGSYKNWGQGVDPKNAKAGDVVLIPAKTASGYHVMMSQGIDPATGKLKIIGGNQGKGEVSERSYDLNKKGMLVRRANELMREGNQQTAMPISIEEQRDIAKVAHQEMKQQAPELMSPPEQKTPQTLPASALDTVPQGLPTTMEPPVGNAAVVESRRKLEPSTLAPATVTETLSNLGINPFGGIANAGIGSDAAATNRAYTPTAAITSVQNTGFGAARPGLPNLGQVLGNAAGSAIGGPMGDIARGGIGGVLGGNPGYGIAGIGQVLGGMAGSAIGGPMGGALGSVISGVGRGLGGMTTPASPNLAAPEPAVASLEATAPQSQKAEQPTGGAASSDSGDMSALVSLMSEQISQLGSLNGLMRKQNSTAEQILKSQK
jgi:uncharacterized protein (TIGR02594 family)